MVDKILVHTEVGTREDTMFAIEEKRHGSPSFYLYYASYTVRRPSAHTYMVLAPLSLRACLERYPEKLYDDK